MGFYIFVTGLVLIGVGIVLFLIDWIRKKPLKRSGVIAMLGLTLVIAGITWEAFILRGQQ